MCVHGKTSYKSTLDLLCVDVDCDETAAVGDERVVDARHLTSRVVRRQHERSHRRRRQNANDEADVIVADAHGRYACVPTAGGGVNL